MLDKVSLYFLAFFAGLFVLSAVTLIGVIFWHALFPPPPPPMPRPRNWPDDWPWNG